mmetsp:Transcript_16960/g.41823  ORF Transcript_16960/g.41823 Transcript_16960/m.41823 type:complete len:340 (+) Transcript_16960:2278-3297(+)
MKTRTTSPPSTPRKQQWATSSLKRTPRTWYPRTSASTPTANGARWCCWKRRCMTSRWTSTRASWHCGTFAPLWCARWRRGLDESPTSPTSLRTRSSPKGKRHLRCWRSRSAPSLLLTSIRRRTASRSPTPSWRRLTPSARRRRQRRLPGGSAALVAAAAAAAVATAAAVVKTSFGAMWSTTQTDGGTIASKIMLPEVTRVVRISKARMVRFHYGSIPEIPPHGRWKPSSAAAAVAAAAAAARSVRRQAQSLRRREVAAAATTASTLTTPTPLPAAAAVEQGTARKLTTRSRMARMHTTGRVPGGVPLVWRTSQPSPSTTTNLPFKNRGLPHEVTWRDRA